MVFECSLKKQNNVESWKGTISIVKDFGYHYELKIESRSSIRIIYGKTTSGFFACFPDFGVGCHMVNVYDRFWNREKLIRVLGKVDGITVEAALFSLASTFVF